MYILESFYILISFVKYIWVLSIEVHGVFLGFFYFLCSFDSHGVYDT